MFWALLRNPLLVGLGGELRGASQDESRSPELFDFPGPTRLAGENPPA